MSSGSPPAQISHTLRPFRPDDADWITRACQDEEIQRWTMVPTPYEHADAAEFVALVSANEAHWAIVDADGQPVGSIGFRNLDSAAPEIGYWIAPWGRHRGAARDGIALAIAEIADLTTADRVQALVATTNVASQRAISSAGFDLVGDSDRDCPDGECAVIALLFERAI